MRKSVYLGLLVAGMLSSMMCFTSLADYKESDSWSANRGVTEELQKELDEAIKKKGELEAKYEKVKAEYEELKPEWEEVSAAYEAGEVDFPTYDKLKYKFGNLEQEYEKFPKRIEEAQETIELLTQLLDERVEEEMEFTGEAYEGEEGLTYTVYLVNEDGNWLLKAPYRHWTEFMGGRWEYSNFVTDGLKMGLYDGNECLVAQAPRANEYDTETALAWDVPDDIEAGKKYYVKVGNKKYGVYADAYAGSIPDTSSSSDSDDREDWDEDDTENYSDSASEYADSRENESDWQNNDEEDTSGGPAAKQGFWMQNEVGWWIQYQDGTYMVNDWYCSPASGLWYYMGTDGYMLTNTVTPDGYTVNADGVWIQ